jgi:hypothetical protein
MRLPHQASAAAIDRSYFGGRRRGGALRRSTTFKEGEIQW